MPTNVTEPRLRIGELADRAGVGAKTIRYYEQVELLPKPTRTTAGYRLYADVDAERLRFIKSARQLGFALGEIKEILELRDHGEAPCAYVAELLEQRRGEVDQAIAELSALKAELDRLSHRARQVGHLARPAAYCHILESRTR